MAQVFVALRGISKRIGDPCTIEEAQAFVKRANEEESRTTNIEGKPIRPSKGVWYWKYVPFDGNRGADSALVTIEQAQQAWRDSAHALALILRQRDEAMKRVEDEWEPLVSAARDRMEAAWKKLEEAKS